MTDLFHYFGEDLQLDQAGALLEASGSGAIRQNILRRLCTNPQAYLWHVDYGAGLPARVGRPIREVETQGVIAAQLAMEASVDQDQPVTVALTLQTVSTYLCSISYTEQGERREEAFTFNQDGAV